MYKLWKTLIVMVIIKGSCLIPSNSVEANVDGHRRHCSNQFCIEKNYEKLELPPPNNGTTVHVVITPHILEIFEVNLKRLNTSHKINANNTRYLYLMYYCILTVVEFLLSIGPFPIIICDLIAETINNTQ